MLNGVVVVRKLAQFVLEVEEVIEIGFEVEGIVVVSVEELGLLSLLYCCQC